MEKNPIQTTILKNKVIEALQDCYDPEIPVNIYDLGLIYDVEITSENNVNITMTLTSPMCPVADSLPLDVRRKVSGIPEVNRVDVEVTWDPPWSPDKMSEAAKLQLNLP